MESDASEAIGGRRDITFLSPLPQDRNWVANLDEMRDREASREITLQKCLLRFLIVQSTDHLIGLIH